MKRLLNAIPLFIALALIAYACTRTASQVPNQTVSTASALEVWQVKPGSVYDGDTLRVVKGNQELKIRFACIDAPEAKQDKGIAARDHLRLLLNRANNQVKINPVDTDRYGRTVAEIYTTSGQLVQLQQVKDGWVWANEKYKSDCPHWNEIAKAEREAKAARRGIWAGNPMPPWEWRRRNQ